MHSRLIYIFAHKYVHFNFMSRLIDNGRRFEAGIITLNICTLEYYVTVSEFFQDKLVAKYSVQIPNPFLIHGYDFEINLN